MPRPSKRATYLDFIIREKGFETDFQDIPYPSDADELRSSFLNDKILALYRLSFTESRPWFSSSLLFLHKVASAFTYALSRSEDIEFLREDAKVDLDNARALALSAPFIPGSEFITEDWVKGLWEELFGIYRKEIAVYSGTVEMYLSEQNNSLHTPGRIFFHLVENKDDEDYEFAFMATYSADSDERKLSHYPLRYALEEYRDDNKRILSLLSPLSKVAERSELIAGLMDSGELFYPIGMDADDALIFLNEVDIYEECGIMCRIPNWWRHRGRTDVSIRIEPRNIVDTNSLLLCVPEMYVDGVQISEEEINELLSQTEGLAMLKGRWVRVDHQKLGSMIERIKEIREQYGDDISIMDAIRLTSGISADKDDKEVPSVSNPEWISTFVKRIHQGGDEEVLPQTDFKGTLREYQKRGVAWLSMLKRMGFGACLADDMGLGKTVQVLAFLESRRSEGDRTLLVVPASLMGNWEKEAGRFTPSMKVHIAHGKNAVPMDADLTVTTYGMIGRHKFFTETEWDNVILDEAQAIKNPSAKQTRDIKNIKGRFKVALTGTPVENSMSDLWSIFDFINCGLFGAEKEFNRFIQKDDEMLYPRIRAMTSPFIMRRLKTDKSIAGDLPDKIDNEEYVPLSKKQVVLYHRLLDELRNALSSVEHKNRTGLVLSMITNFKQVCNHPDQYLGQKGYAEADSGKMEMLRQICETIRDKRERVLVFTQYREMTDPLMNLLGDVFGRPGLVIHGGITPKERTEIVRRFNSEDEYVPFMVLTLKAGGVGLNLTAANHVVHFDRWWNPAVENQATDRAFRIGQKKNVIVHKFICKGTVEERIDELIKSKTELATNIIGEGESWITKMDDRELLDLFRLD